jgi:ABC-2 type transport system permease protein
MLWYKAWRESRTRFLLSAVTIAGLCVLFVLIQSDARASMDSEPLTYVGYIWRIIYKGYLRELFILLVLLLGAGGLLRERAYGTASYTLALPISRWRTVVARAVTGVLEVVVLSVLPALVIPALSPVVHQSYPWSQALQFSLLWSVAGALIFSVGFLFSVVFGGEYSAPVVAFVVLLAYSVIDTKLKQFLPFLSGISAIDPTFSRDGKWVAYTAYPDHTLWRSRADGTDRLQLTYPPIEASYPFISPDGKQVTFNNGRGDIYVVGMDGSSLRRVVEKHAPVACWSPDGNSLVLTAWIEGKPARGSHAFQLEILDLRSGKRSVVPSSEGMIGAWWVADDTLLAGTQDTTKLLAFDLKAGKRTDLVSGAIVNWAPSPDGKYFYYSTGDDNPKAMRIRLADRKVEEIAPLLNLRRVNDPVDDNTQISVAPDGSPVFTRDIGSEEIYALYVRWR